MHIPSASVLVILLAPFLLWALLPCVVGIWAGADETAEALVGSCCLVVVGRWHHRFRRGRSMAFCCLVALRGTQPVAGVGEEKTSVREQREAEAVIGFFSDRTADDVCRGTRC